MFCELIKQEILLNNTIKLRLDHWLIALKVGWWCREDIVDPGGVVTNQTVGATDAKQLLWEVKN